MPSVPCQNGPFRQCTGTLGFLAYDRTKNTLRSRGLLCGMVDHIKGHEMCQTATAIATAIMQPSTIVDSSSTTTSFSLKQSRSFLGNQIYSHLVRIPHRQGKKKRAGIRPSTENATELQLHLNTFWVDSAPYPQKNLG